MPMDPLRQLLRYDKRESSQDAADEGKQTEYLNIGEQEAASMLNTVNRRQKRGATGQKSEQK